MTRIGIGYDIHALKKGRPLRLGGITIPFEKGLQGHSDGDALLHAIVDAILGALGKGDIGEYFSDKDEKNRNANSLVFAKKAVDLVKKNKMKISNIDTIVIAEAPKLLQYKQAMRESVAKAFGVPAARVNVKAKTNEGFGALGRNEAIACHAAVSLSA
jgi:2-C-methyl-D-erythritol 2,4-cyclodiphosphate synthase